MSNPTQMSFAFDVLIINIDIIHFQFALKYLLCCTLYIKNNTSKFEYQGGSLKFGYSIDNCSDDRAVNNTQSRIFLFWCTSASFSYSEGKSFFLECLWLCVVTKKKNTKRKRWCDRLKCTTLLASEENYYN